MQSTHCHPPFWVNESKSSWKVVFALGFFFFPKFFCCLCQWRIVGRICLIWVNHQRIKEHFISIGLLEMKLPVLPLCSLIKPSILFRLFGLLRAFWKRTANIYLLSLLECVSDSSGLTLFEGFLQMSSWNSSCEWLFALFKFRYSFQIDLLQ